MQKRSIPYQKIIFVCTNHREDPQRPCCNRKGGSQFRAALKEAIAERNLQSKIRVSQSGCLGLCAEGPNVLIYPDGIWYAHVTESDLETILNEAMTGVDNEN